MNGRTTDSSETIDRKTSRSICDAVGERLQQSLRPEISRLSPRLQHLMDELCKRDRAAAYTAPNRTRIRAGPNRRLMQSDGCRLPVRPRVVAKNPTRT
jgi:hypothetical protein